MADAEAAPRPTAAQAATHRTARACLGRDLSRRRDAVISRRWSAWLFLLLVGGATLAACALFYTEDVTVKLLPFDNKSELTVLVEPAGGQQPGGTEQTLFAAARIVGARPR